LPAGVLTDGIGNTTALKPVHVKLIRKLLLTGRQTFLMLSHANRYGNGRNLSDNTFSAAVSLRSVPGAESATSQMFALFQWKHHRSL
jgi:lysozyme